MKGLGGLGYWRIMNFLERVAAVLVGLLLWQTLKLFF